jgi:ATPase subunit of ABC transporter with duplicated ATPase domains
MDLHFSSLCKSYKGKRVFENIDGQIGDGDKIGLIGANGVGKTTLARLLAGRESCDAGQVNCSPSYMEILYIEQYPIFDTDISVYGEACRAVSNNGRDIKDTKRIVQTTLDRVGLGREKWQQRAETLSGGEKTKLLLCKAMMSQFDLLILDEPTNHLDMDSYVWLEEFVGESDKPMLIISHDRFFLDNAVNRIWELTPLELKAYEGNYSAYRLQREIEQKSIAKDYDKQQTKIRHLKQVIYERKGWYESAHKSAGQNDFYRSKAKKHAGVLKAKEKQLERIEKDRIDKPRKLVSPAFEVINKNITGKKLPSFLVRGKNISKGFAQNLLFDSVSFNIKRRDRIALIGQNGVGKTTFLKVVCGIDKDYGGTVAVNPSVKIGYFAQEFDNLDNDAAILDELVAVGAGVGDVRLLLAGLLFRGDDVYKRIGNLSMGEKGRVAFVKLILSGANLLVLDEPTNYMDIQSREKIEKVLDEFGGSIIFVTHDRYFIRKLANRIFVMENQKLCCYDGDYEYYMDKLKEERAKKETGAGYRRLADNIRKLECQLAFLSGKLSETKDEHEKQILNEKFLETAMELNGYKESLNGQEPGSES